MDESLTRWPVQMQKESQVWLSQEMGSWGSASWVDIASAEHVQVYLWSGWGISPKDSIWSSASNLWKTGTVIWCPVFLELVPAVNMLFCCLLSVCAVPVSTESHDHLACFSQIQRWLVSHNAASNVFVRPMVTQLKFWCRLVTLNGKR